MTGLFLWTVVALAGNSGGIYERRDWREIAVFTSPAACESAIKRLGVQSDLARCVPKY